MALKNAPRVGIHNKDGVIPCVEQDGVGGFRANAVNGQEPLSQLRGGNAEHRREGATMFLSQEHRKFLELARFLPEVAGGADEAGELCPGNFFPGERGEQPRLAQIGDGALYVYPTGVLNQDGAGDYFERRSAGPPVLFAVGLKQRIEILGEYRQALLRGPRDMGLRAAGGSAKRRTGGGRGGQSGARTHLIRTISTGCQQV